MSVHKFRPRYRGVAFGSIGFGGALGTAAISLGFATIPLAAGALGIAFGVVYLLSPSWRFRIVTDDDGIEVHDHKGTRFRLRWTEIVRVVASPSTKTCFIDGGVPEKSILVPGVGAPAPYAISDRDELFATILAHVTPDRIETVETLERAASTTKPA